MIRRPHRSRLRLESLEDRVVPAYSVYNPQTFDAVPIASLPSDWQSWNTSPNASFAVSDLRSVSKSNSLLSSGTNSQPARAWWTTVFPADFGVQTMYLPDSTAQVQLLARGSDLTSSQASDYAVNLSASHIDLVRVLKGQSATLSTVTLKMPVNQWMQASLVFQGDAIAIEIYRPDTGLYLNYGGTWQSTPALAIRLNDAVISAGGLIGVARTQGTTGNLWLDNFGVVLPDAIPSGSSTASNPPVKANTSGSASGVQENFDSTAVGNLPTGWVRFTTSDPPNQFAVSAFGYSGRGLSSFGMSNTTSRAWYDTPVSADVSVSASIYLDTLIPAQVISRGSNLDTTTPTFYSASITRDLTVQLLATVGGQTTLLGSLRSASYFSDKWIRLTLTTVGTRLQVAVQRLDTGEYLNATGVWQNSPAFAFDRTDSSIGGSGKVGVARSALYYGTITFDDFQAIPQSNTSQQPTVMLDPLTSLLSGTIHVSANASSGAGIDHVEFSLDGILQKTVSSAQYSWDFDTVNQPNGSHTLTVKAIDRSGNSATATSTVTIQNTPVAPPSVPKHYSHIRIAELAYNGNPMGATEQQLLANSVDLVIPYTGYLSKIDQTAPNTPQLIYTNASNLYLDLYTDWLNYADAHGVSRESAFYHVTQSTPWTGASPSSQPVNWFFNVLRTSTNLTEASHGSTGFSLGDLFESTKFGYPEKFAELNFDIKTPPNNFYSFTTEYVSKVDAAGNPIEWKRLPLNYDGTFTLQASGKMTFDPPADWVPAVVSGSSARLYYVRVRNTSYAPGPIVRSVLGRDYTNSTGSSGTIPAFDYSADKNGDGYLSDAEYANRAPGKDARFIYESRLFYPYYGPQRFVANPSSSAYRDWVADYSTRLLNANPLADGLFVDNSAGGSPLNGASVFESTSTYASDYGSLIGNLNRKIAPKWLIANTAGDASADDTLKVVRQAPATLEEFALRPLATNWTRFEDESQLVRTRQAANPAGYLILDSLPTGGSPSDARTQIATLAYYYLLGNPDTTFLLFNGGYAPNTSWNDHWSPAAAYNVGQPQGTWTTFATGTDPSNPSLSYKVEQRSYANALVLYKPLSYSPTGGTGTLADSTATTHQLGGNYRPLRADGTLGPVTNSVTLRNGEGAILIRA